MRRNVYMLVGPDEELAKYGDVPMVSDTPIIPNGGGVSN